MQHLHITYLEVQRKLTETMSHVSKSFQSLFRQEAKSKMCFIQRNCTTRIIMLKKPNVRVTKPLENCVEGTL